MNASEKIFMDAYFGGYAVASFAVDDAMMCRALIAAAEDLSAPVAISLRTNGEEKDLLRLFGTVKNAVEETKVPVSVFAVIDSGDGIPEKNVIDTALRFGFQIRLKVDAVTSVHQVIGTVRDFTLSHVGVTDRKVLIEAPFGRDAERSDAECAVLTATVAGVSLLNVPTIATSMEGPDIYRIHEIGKALAKNNVTVPLSGGDVSGFPEPSVRSMIREGICLVTFEREIRRTYLEAIRRSVAERQKEEDPIKHFSAGAEAVRSAAVGKILLCGCNGKA